MSENEMTSARKVSAAVVLSLLLPGLGQVYCGQLLRGLVLVGIGSLLMTVAMAVAGLNMDWGGVAIVMYLLGQLVVMVWAAVDAGQLAKRAGEGYVLKPMNHFGVYFLLLVIGGGAGAMFPALEVRRNFLHAFKVPNASMYPTIVPGDQVLAEKSAYRQKDPKRGDVVVFYEPGSRTQHFVKRVVGVAGDRIEMEGGVLKVNGEAVTGNGVAGSDGTEEGELCGEVIDGVGYRVFWGEGERQGDLGQIEALVVPDYAVYVLGDNRGNSRDSRHFGAVPVIGVVGEVGYRYFPGDLDFGRIGSVGDRENGRK